MAVSYVSQKIQSTRRGNTNVVATVVRLDSADDTIELPRFAAQANCVVQLRRNGDKKVTVTQATGAATKTDSARVQGGANGDEILLISLHSDPIVEQQSLAP